MKMSFAVAGVFSRALLLSPVAALAAQSNPTPPAAAEEVVNLSEFVVTGSSIRGQELPVGSSLVSISRDDIMVVAPQTTRDLIATVPQFGQFNVATTPSIFLSEAPNMRGLGQGTTLTMLNGRRLVGLGLVTTAGDPSVIPPSAIDRIQVVPDGSSAIYGSDAVAGVINIMTRRDFEGAEVSARLGFADGYETSSYSGVLGETWASGSLMISYDYAENTALLGHQRDFVTNDLRAYGGPDNRSTNTSMPNVVVGGVFYAYPDLQPNTTNRIDTAKVRAIVPENRRHSLLGTIRQRVSDRIEAFADIVLSKNTAISAWPMNQSNAFTFTMNNTNPYFKAPPGTNATAVQVRYSFGRDFGDAYDLLTISKGGSISTGVELKLGRDWTAEITGTYGWSRTQMDQVVLNLTAASAAAAGTTLTTAFDPFTGLTNAAILEQISDTLYIDLTHQELIEGTIKADGPLFTWAGGVVRAALGAQTRFEMFKPTTQKGPADTTPRTSVTAEREVNGVFGEILFPVFGNDNRRTGLKRLDLSAAARFETYDSFGDTTNPKFGLNWEPVTGLLVRGSYGTSFRAPALSSVQSVATAVEYRPNNTQNNIVPPGSPPLNTVNIIGGNPNLGPEEARTRSIGIDLMPTNLKGFRASLTYYKIHYTNVIGGPQNRFANPNLAFTYILNPTEAQIDEWVKGLPIAGTRFAPGQTGIIVDSRSQNLRTLDVTGLDYDVSQRWTTGFGSLHASVGGTSYLDYESAAAPGVAPTNSLAQGTVKTKLRSSLGWRKGSLAGSVSANYTGSYKNVAVTPVQDVDAFLTFDVTASWTIANDGWLKDSTLALNLNNALDEDPPAYAAGDGFNGGLSSPIGRLLSVSLTKKF